MTPTFRSLLLAALLAMACARAGSEPVPEADMKAAFIFNFAVFTEWPVDALAANAPLTLCARPASALYPLLVQLAEKTVHGHRIAVKPTPPNAPAPRDCQVLYLDSGERERWPQLKRDLAGLPVLTVSDDSSIGGDGAVIFMEMEHRRLAFDIELASARAARLNLSSKLLRLARAVQ